MVITDRSGQVMQVANLTDLDKAIAELELKKTYQEEQIHQKFDDLKEGLKPVNILKSAVHKVTSTNTPIELGLKVAGAIATVLIAKKVFSDKEDDEKEDNEVVKRIIITKEKKSNVSRLAQGMVTNFLINHIPTITAYSKAIYHNLFQEVEDDVMEEEQ